MAIQQDKVVRINYQLTSPEGEVLDTSEGREPLAYLHGRGNLIPGLEQALEGKDQGDEVEVTIEPDEAYGQRDESLVQEVDRQLFANVDSLEPGMRFNAQTESGSRPIQVLEVNDDSVKVDANHPLAGVPLHFNVSVVEVREPTDQEKEQGQAQ